MSNTSNDDGQAKIVVEYLLPTGGENEVRTTPLQPGQTKVKKVRIENPDSEKAKNREKQKRHRERMRERGLVQVGGLYVPESEKSTITDLARALAEGQDLLEWARQRKEPQKAAEAPEPAKEVEGGVDEPIEASEPENEPESVEEVVSEMSADELRELVSEYEAWRQEVLSMGFLSRLFARWP